jgi:hypothetical protein
MSVYDHRCSDCQVCPECGRSAWCEGDRILVVPCEHHGYCGDCNLANCIDCRLEAEREMYISGEYDPHADPFFLGECPELDVAAWLAEVDAKAKARGFDPATNSYTNHGRTA